MVNRTLQYANGSYFSVIPRALIDSFGLKLGDKVSIGIATIPQVNAQALIKRHAAVEIE